MSLPVFEVLPAVLAVDLSLGPGDERRCECGEQYVPLASHFDTLLKSAVGVCRATAVPVRLAARAR
jgi:hypothetical protein